MSHTIGHFQQAVLDELATEGVPTSVGTLRDKLSSKFSRRIQQPQVSEALKRLRVLGYVDAQPGTANGKVGAPTTEYFLTDKVQLARTDSFPIRERMLGSIQVILLALIGEPGRVDTSGDAMQEIVQELVGYIVTPAQIYTALRRLEERGFIVPSVVPRNKQRGRPKHRYLLTPAGDEALETHRRLARFVIEKSPNG